MSLVSNYVPFYAKLDVDLSNVGLKDREKKLKIHDLVYKCFSIKHPVAKAPNLTYLSSLIDRVGLVCDLDEQTVFKVQECVYKFIVEENSKLRFLQDREGAPRNLDFQGSITSFHFLLVGEAYQKGWEAAKNKMREIAQYRGLDESFLFPTKLVAEVEKRVLHLARNQTFNHDQLVMQIAKEIRESSVYTTEEKKTHFRSFTSSFGCYTKETVYRQGAFARASFS